VRSTKSSGEKHDAERRLPRNVHAEANGIGEVGVERHAGRKGDGIIGVKPHHKCGDRGRNARREQNAFLRHPGLRENLWIHDDDVRHRHERGQAAEHFLANRGLIFRQLEIALQQFASANPRKDLPL
jgi:hypothetical protein